MTALNGKKAAGRGLRGVSAVEAEGQGPEVGQGLAEAHEEPLQAQPFDNVGVLPAPTWTRL